MGARLQPIDGLRGRERQATAQLDNVQVLRGIAAALVLLSHVGSIGYLFKLFPTFDAHHGIFGVDLFFVISGFIMVYTTREAWGAPGSFLAKRAYRIYPLWWLCLFIQAPEILRYFTGFWDEYGPYYIKAVLLFPASTNRGDLYPPLVVGWTLIYEMLFYIVFAASMLFPRRWMLPIVSTSLVGLLVLGNLLPANTDAAKFLGNPIYLEFLLGMAVGRLLLTGKLSRSVAIAATILGLASLAFIKMGDHFRVLYYGLPAVAVLAWALVLPSVKGALRHPLVLLGDASYALYLSHGLVIMALAGFLQKNPDFMPVWAGLAALIIVPILAGITLHFAVERPLFTLKRVVENGRGIRAGAEAS